MSIFFFQAIFRGGRTETLRPGTLETRACTEAFNSGKTLKAAELLSLMRNCSKTHQQLTKNAAQGKSHVAKRRTFENKMFLIENIVRI